MGVSWRARCPTSSLGFLFKRALLFRSRPHMPRSLYCSSFRSLQETPELLTHFFLYLPADQLLLRCWKFCGGFMIRFLCNRFTTALGDVICFVNLHYFTYLLFVIRKNKWRFIALYPLSVKLTTDNIPYHNTIYF